MPVPGSIPDDAREEGRSAGHPDTENAHHRRMGRRMGSRPRTTPSDHSHPAIPKLGPESEETTGKIQLEEQMADPAEAEWEQYYAEYWGDQGEAWEVETAARDAKCQLELEAGQ